MLGETEADKSGTAGFAEILPRLTRRNRKFPPALSCHAPKGQTIAGVACDHFRGHVHLQALSSRLNSIAAASEA
jgi:hypothetical protein